MKMDGIRPFSLQVHLQFTSAKRNSDRRLHSHCAECLEGMEWAPVRAGNRGLPQAGADGRPEHMGAES